VLVAGLRHGRQQVPTISARSTGYLPDDFTPWPVYFALQNTNVLFADTRPDPPIKVALADIPALRDKSRPFLAYGFRRRAGKPIAAC